MKGAIFDLDGTILDSLYIWDSLVEVFLEKEDLDFDPDIKEEIAQMNLEESSSYLVKKYKMDKSPDQVLSDIKDILRSYYAEVFQPKDYVVDYIKGLNEKGWTLSIATTLDLDLALMVLERLDLLKYFKKIYTEDQLALSKRETDFFDYIVKDLAIDPDRLYLFEDSSYSLESAKPLGIRLIGVMDQYNMVQKEKIEGLADRLIYNFREMESI